MLFGRGFAKFEDLGVVHVGEQIFRFFAELIDLLRLAQVLKERFLVRVVLKLLNQLLDRFHRNSSIRWVGHKMFLRLVLVDLVDRCANSL